MGDLLHVLLADDHELVLAGLKAVLRGCDGFSVVGEARDGNEAVSAAVRLRPDLVVLDVRMPKLNGVEACRQIRSQVPSTRVLMLTCCPDEKAVIAAIVAGASGFVLKETRTAELIEAMRRVGHGGAVLGPSSAGAVIEQIRGSTLMSDEERRAMRLSDRELLVLDLVSNGMTNREIGDKLSYSEKTVKEDVSSILAKLGINGRVEAAAFAVRWAARRSSR